MTQGPAAGAAADPAAEDTCLAVDAGNSKTDVAVVSADGTVLGTARGGGFQPPAVGVPAAVGALARTVARAVVAAGGGRERFGPGGETDRPLVAEVSACLANADLPPEERELGTALTRLGWGHATRVRNDTFAILRAGLPDDGSVRHGVAVVCGAGINCVGRADDGRTHRFPAVGRLSGDWGGGAGLAGEALWHAARSADGRGSGTELERALPAHFGLSGMAELIEALHLGRIAPERRNELAPVLFAVADAGDAVARGLVHRQADEVVALAAVTLERLGLLGVRTPVLLGGGVLAARHPLLHDRLTERLAERAPRAVPRPVAAPPVLGAALLGLDRLGAGGAAYARLRAHYAPPAGPAGTAAAAESPARAGSAGSAGPADTAGPGASGAD
ncbi:N-acetylglucosamine kinase [Streptomyces sp. JJ36]|uniref:N-acetylglucosamine kinase n=1 Tax=Streptomyces sp. JJ36 TaxID=2736645 RepID=UPI001F16A875|nr:BadF/BadG/BcrA/BcrD ATPase family protein [Streptomyces sp. JJ36]